jgi:tagaturonate reductase
MRLTRKNIENIRHPADIEMPAPASFGLPEKVLQFGTGVLLRGLPDYFIDRANKQGLFGGRIVMVKSTSQGGTDAFERQDNLYTLCVRGLEEGRKVEDYFLVNAVSRVLSAKEQWSEVLALAKSKDMEVVISNTTEVGIQLTEDDITSAPPASYPGKLLAFLYARYQAFNGDAGRGVVIIPTELLTDNASKLKGILVQLAKNNRLPDGFIDWLSNCNSFCNSLVDRIVPGRLPEDEQKELEKKLGYEDELLISAEPYRLWAIETPGGRTDGALSFSKADRGIILAPDITVYRELKLRLLNGSHTFSCAMAYLIGFDTVGEAMEDEAFSRFINELMLDEIAPAISGSRISEEEARAFALTVMDRFRNPFIEHPWLSIAVQYSSKMKMRNVPIIRAHYSKSATPPAGMSAAFAAYILFMRCERQPDGSWTGTRNGEPYTIRDDSAPLLAQWWEKYPENPVAAILSDQRLWDCNLASLPGFQHAVEAKMLAWKDKQQVTPV